MAAVAAAAVAAAAVAAAAVPAAAATTAVPAAPPSAKPRGPAVATPTVTVSLASPPAATAPWPERARFGPVREPARSQRPTDATATAKQSGGGGSMGSAWRRPPPHAPGLGGERLLGKRPVRMLADARARAGDTIR